MQVPARLRYPLGVAGLVLATVLLRGAVERLFRQAVETGFPVWLPTFGPVGRTVLVYQWLMTAFSLLVVPAAAFWLGVRYGRE